jgi:tRNA threonylcarbamoyladenosine biosynthesis protein TsaE
MPPLPQPLHEERCVEGTSHAPILETRRVRWANEGECEAFARRAAARGAWRDAIVELCGPLGAGKTAFARHLLRALGVAGRIKSPSYAVVEPYEVGPLSIWHFDFYRFAGPHEWEDAGLRDLFAAPGLKLTEWPERAEGLLPRPDLRIVITPIGETDRRVELQAFTPRGREMLG